MKFTHICRQLKRIGLFTYVNLELALYLSLSNEEIETYFKNQPTP